MPLDVMLRGLLARQRRLDGTAEQPGGHRGLRLDGELLFRAERATARGQLNLDIRRRHVQHPGNRLLIEDRPLAFAVDLDAPALGIRQARFGFEERRIDRLRRERRLDDVRGLPERRLHVTTSELGRRLDDVRRRPERVVAMHAR